MPRRPATTATSATDDLDDLVETAQKDAGEDPVHPAVDIVNEAQRIFADDMSKRPVVVKLARIMEAMPELKPEGRNAHFGYGFIKDTQVSGALRKRLAHERIMIVPDVVDESWVETATARGGTSWVTKMKIKFTAIDGDSGDEISGHGYGYGDDTGDKGANKAFTAALKYWLLKLFMIGGEDLEDDNRADERAALRQAGGVPQPVTVQGAQIEGIARGGRSDKITATQVRQIGALVKEMEMSPELFAEYIEKASGKKVSLPDNDDPGPALKNATGALSADDAGKLISLLVERKDSENEEDGIPEDDGGGGYG